MIRRTLLVNDHKLALLEAELNWLARTIMPCKWAMTSGIRPAVRQPLMFPQKAA